MEPDTKALIQMGREAALSVAGPDAVQEVEVSPDWSFERPIYRFSFLIDQDRAIQSAGLLRSRLIQRLSDDLIARNDDHHPVVQILDRVDWDQRERA